MKIIFYKRFFPAGLALLLCLLAACGSPAAPSKTITDREGSQIQLPDKAERIISMAPSITEILVGLGLSEHIVATDEYSRGLEGLPEGLPVFDMMNPDAEQILALQPDILFATGMSKFTGDDPFALLRTGGVCLTYIPAAGSLKAIEQDIAFIGEVTGRQAQAQTMVDEMRGALQAVAERIPTQATPPRVYFEIYNSPMLYSFGQGVFLDDMLQQLGAENIFADKREWISVAEEIIVERRPDVIITNAQQPDHPAEAILQRSGWEATPALQNGRVYEIDYRASTQPSQHVVKAFAEIAKVLYPEVFK